MSAGWGLATAAVLVVGVLLWFGFQNGTGYPLDQAQQWISRAKTGGHAEEMISYLNEAELILQDFKGNPAWWYPTSRTSFDLIKRDLGGNIERLHEMKKLNRTDDAYNQGLDDVRGKLAVLSDQLRDTTDVLWYQTPSNIGLAVILLILGFIFLIFALAES